MGVAVALVTWAYDYQFFLNPGGPEAPISQAIRRAINLEHANALLFVFGPLLVLVTCGAVIGSLVSLVVARTRSIRRPHS